MDRVSTSIGMADDTVPQRLSETKRFDTDILLIRIADRGALASTSQSLPSKNIAQEPEAGGGQPDLANGQEQVAVLHLSPRDLDAGNARS